MAREHALHFCPEKPNAALAMPSAAPSRSALAPTIAAFLPPISASTGRGTGPSASRREPGRRKRPPRRPPPDLAAALGRACERDAVHSPTHERLAALRPSVHERNDTAGHPGLGEQARDGATGVRRLLRRLED